MSSDWFPRPELARDVEAVPPPSSMGPDELFELPRDPGAVEWRDRVGAVGRADGSAKAALAFAFTARAVARRRGAQPRGRSRESGR